VYVYDFYFSSNFDTYFFFELIALRASGGMLTNFLYISYGFGDKKALAKVELQSFNFLFFPQILMQFFAN
jgi:hypothetical protein